MALKNFHTLKLNKGVVIFYTKNICIFVYIEARISKRGKSFLSMTKSLVNNSKTDELYSNEDLTRENSYAIKAQCFLFKDFSWLAHLIQCTNEGVAGNSSS